MTREPDRYEVRACAVVETWNAGASWLSDLIAAALRREREDALDEAKGICRRVASEEAPRSQVGKHAALRCEELIGYAMKSPAAAPAAETHAFDPAWFNDISQSEYCEHCGKTRPEHAQPSKPTAPAPDWSVRAGDKCTRVACDKKVVAACLPHQFGGCEEHMREHDARCSYELKALADGGEGKT